MDQLSQKNISVLKYENRQCSKLKVWLCSKLGSRTCGMVATLASRLGGACLAGNQCKNTSEPVGQLLVQ